jgi:multicomponent Na+:H+ antiporter subunit G
MTAVWDLLGATLVLLGAFLCLAAAVGPYRFPDVLNRMHAATKPQTLGLLVVVTGLAVSLRTWAALSTMLLIVALQLATSPVSAHLVGRAAYRSGQYRRDLVDHDDLADDLTAAGFDLTDQAGDDHVGPDTDAG